MSVVVDSPSIVEKPVAKPRVRIVLVEDHIILREGLKALIEIEPDFEIIGEFGAAELCLAGIGQLQPDLVVTDLELPQSSGIELLAQIKHIVPNARKLVLTAHNSEEYIRAALNAGADGYVLKDTNRAELLSAIRTVCAGQQFICAAVADRIVSGYLSGGEAWRNHVSMRSVTGREREVLTRIALGDSNKVIARALTLSVKTVEKHRSNIMRKLNLHNAAAITLFAVRNGLMREPLARVQLDAGLAQNVPVT
jgi:DNA-binding NarL/FixJ family response regulator